MIQNEKFAASVSKFEEPNDCLFMQGRLLMQNAPSIYGMSTKKHMNVSCLLSMLGRIFYNFLPSPSHKTNDNLLIPFFKTNVLAIKKN